VSTTLVRRRRTPRDQVRRPAGTHHVLADVHGPVVAGWLGVSPPCRSTRASQPDFGLSASREVNGGGDPSVFGVLIAYVDESGDPSGSPQRGGSDSYALGVVVVRSEHWADAFDGLINFRRDMRQTFGIPFRSEIKASSLVRNEGPFKGGRMSASQRRYVYKRHLDVMARLNMRAFSVYTDKRQLEQRGALSQTRWLVWETLFQRLSLMHDRDEPGSKSPVLLMHDEGEELTIRGYSRKARRFLTSGSAYGTGSLRLSQRWLIDDPVSRQSNHSYFIQCADLTAYASTKRMIPGGARAARVCPPSMWDALGEACHRPANEFAVRRDPTLAPGIVVRRA